MIVFPSGFTESVAARASGQAPVAQENATIKILADKSNPNVSDPIIGVVNGAVAQTIQGLGRQAPVSVDTSQAIYGANSQFIDFFAPGIISIAVWQLTTLLTLISFVGERTSGTLLRLLASPLKESELVAGYAVAFGIIGTAQSAVLLAVAAILFNVTIVGDVLLAFVVIALLAIVSEGLGVLLSSLARRETQAIQFLSVVVLPAFLLSGVFWPIQAIPTWLRPVSYLLPTTYGSKPCARSSCVGGVSIRYTPTSSRSLSLPRSFSRWPRFHCAGENNGTRLDRQPVFMELASELGTQLCAVTCSLSNWMESVRMLRCDRAI